MTSDGVEVEAEEKLAYGYWAVKVREDQRGRFELWEYDSDTTTFVPGSSLTLKYCGGTNTKYASDTRPNSRHPSRTS
jgi:hypothetical protein